MFKIKIEKIQSQMKIVLLRSQLYDLMTMVVTYQMSQCTFGTEMLWVTVNHIRGIRECVSLPAVVRAVNQAHQKFIQVRIYKSISWGPES